VSRWAQPAGEELAGRWGRPTEEELAAILAAVELCWPRPIEAAAPPAEAESPWRFSGRWWTGPVTARRPRPWVNRGV